MKREPLPGIVRVPVVFVNAYLVDLNPGVPDDGWMLVDTGLRGAGAVEIARATARRYGRRGPAAIVLTHGHFDHAGSARRLARRWRAPIFAHELEMAYLTGLSDYPPPDPTVGGALAMMSRAFPHSSRDLRPHVQPVPADGTIPSVPGWRVIHTPGHTLGHISLWRESDGVLLAGDALATMDQESWTKSVTMPVELRWPPAPLTTDWNAARESVLRLAALGPCAIATGHGVPFTAPHIAEALDTFAECFRAPAHGRYVARPVLADRRGIVELPPPVPDPVGRLLRGAAASAALAAFVIGARARHSA
jgi:glyoxylase-like metal-dependent hydrolase (beta-lactamase superfamily II)